MKIFLKEDIFKVKLINFREILFDKQNYRNIACLILYDNIANYYLLLLLLLFILYFYLQSKLLKMFKEL